MFYLLTYSYKHGLPTGLINSTFADTELYVSACTQNGIANCTLCPIKKKIYKQSSNL